MIKGIHFADAHIGVDTVGPVDPTTGINGRVLDYLDMLDSIVDFAENENIDIALFAGDAFHTRNPNQVYINEFAKRINRLKVVCPVVLLVGNHDMSNLDKPSAIQIYDTLGVDNVIVGNTYELHMIDTKAGKIQVTTIPYPTKQLLGATKSKNVDAEVELQKYMKNLIWKLGGKVDDCCPSILLGHFSVEGARYGVEQNYGGVMQFPVSLESLDAPEWDYVALGHIHSHQAVTPKIVYSGSFDRVTFGEEREAKGFVLFNVEPGNCEWEFIQTDSRPFVTVEVDCLGAKYPTKRVINHIEKADLKSAVVRLIIKIGRSFRSGLDMHAIEIALEQSGMYCVTPINFIQIQDMTSRVDSNKFNTTIRNEDMLKSYLDMLDKSDKEKSILLEMGIGIMHEQSN